LSVSRSPAQSGSANDPRTRADFSLLKMFVRGYCSTRRHVFRQHQMLRAIALRGWRLEYPAGKLLFDSINWISNPKISPDDKWIAFADHENPGGDDEGSVAVIGADGNEKEKKRASGWQSRETNCCGSGAEEKRPPRGPEPGRPLLVDLGMVDDPLARSIRCGTCPHPYGTHRTSGFSFTEIGKPAALHA
jgi:hypothetical protein